jgi:hypothetical protein
VCEGLQGERGIERERERESAHELNSDSRGRHRATDRPRLEFSRPAERFTPDRWSGGAERFALPT